MSSLPGLLALPAAAYLASGVLYLWRVLRRSPQAGTWGAVAALVGALIHAGLLVTRIAQDPRAIAAGVGEAASAISFVAVVCFLIGERLLGIGAMGAAVMPLAFGGLLVGLGSPVGAREIPEQLRNPWFFVHVPSALLAYVAFAFAFGAAALYLGEARLLRSKRIAAVLGTLPPLDQLEHLMYRTAAFGFLLMTIGMGTGAIWAQDVWHRYWQWTPKQSASLVTWLLFATYLHSRVIRGSRARSGAWIIIIGFASCLVTFLVVGLLRHDPHRFL
jgi:cytochrome c-type biogenesis protein CcsB